MSKAGIIVALFIAGSLIGLFQLVKWQERQIEQLEQLLEIEKASAAAAKATASLLRAELESDASVDALTDDDLRTAPNEWMLERPGTAR